MNQTLQQWPRGAEWRQWDLHVHTPASFHWNGPKFDVTGDWNINSKLVDDMIEALNFAEPTVFALMDYWTFDGWFALKRRLAEENAPILKKKVFPGIELRLAAPMVGRLNAHVLFSDAIEDQILSDFKTMLTIELINRSLSDNALVALARMVGEDKLKHHGFNKVEVDADYGKALKAGSTIAEINSNSYKSAINKVPNGQAIGFMPFNTNDGLAEIKWYDHYSYCLRLFKSSPIFETRDHDTWAAFVGERTPGNSRWIENFQRALDGVPRLAVSGSDAHCFKGVPGNNDKRGYGDFPSGKITWIKADPTFLGLLQAIKEPAKRSFIGEKPPKLIEVESNKTYFIDRVEINKNLGSPLSDIWLDGCSIPLSTDLVAVIGNKGSGKSAFADVIALLGRTRPDSYFSFLQKNRFRGKSGDPARQFTAKITWLSGAPYSTNLNTDPPEGSAELIRYLPQGYFEKLCTDHTSGKSNAFQTELQSVIFDHASDEIRLGALDFDQLVERQEGAFRDSLIEYRKELTRINRDMENLESQSQPQVKRSLQELLELKRKQIEEHNLSKPAQLIKPDEKLTLEQQAAAEQIEAITGLLAELDDKLSQGTAIAAAIAAKRKAARSVRDRAKLLERQYAQFQVETTEDFRVVGLTPVDLVSLKIDLALLDTAETGWMAEEATFAESRTQLNSSLQQLQLQQAAQKVKLNGPQLEYQKNLTLIQQWDAKLLELTGVGDAPETLSGITARIAQLSELPQQLVKIRERRLALAGEIFDALNAQREAREKLFKPVQDLIQENQFIRNEYRLQFQATLGGSTEALASALFSLIKQNSGEFNGEDESYATVKRLTELFNLGDKADALKFVQELEEKIHGAAAKNNPGTIGIAPVLRKDRLASAVYDLLYGLSYLEPRYSLLFQDAEIEQLSPGQRGALLLIFYLLVDKGRNPIILDQPEENLDNETVYNLLVPVLTEAKKRRQIIMVTHNPNLAVVCDAEQLIYSSFERKSGLKITYLAGSIENPLLNSHVVNVLEGTKPAFENRRIKYH